MNRHRLMEALAPAQERALGALRERIGAFGRVLVA